MITVKYVPNILNDEGRLSVQLPYARDFVLSDYVAQSGFDVPTARYILSGKAVKNVNIHIDNGDEIIVTPEVKWPAIVIAFEWIVANIGWISAVLSAAYAIYSICSYKKPTQPNTGGSGTDESSPTYGWDGIQTTQDVGLTMPVVYGRHKVGGNIINSFIRTDGDKNYLNALIGLCEGEIESISDIKINSQAIGNYSGVTTSTRYGANNQTIIDNFNDLHTMFSLSQNLGALNSSYVYTTIASDVEAFETYFIFPNGIYQQDATDGTILQWAVSYTVEWRVSGIGGYTSSGTQTVNEKSHTSVRRIYRKDGLAAAKYDVRITRTSAATGTNTQGDLTLSNIDEIRTDDLIYPNTALLGIEAMATDQLSGGMPQFSCIVEGKKVSIPAIMNGTAYVGWEDYYWDSAASLYKKLSDSSSLTWDGISYVTAFSANPIWCLRDLLTSTRYGLGDYVSTSLLNQSELVTMSKYCEERVADGESGYEKRFRLDMVLDTSQRVPDLLSTIASVFRGLIFFSEGQIKIKIDKIDSPVQMFNMGNIIADSFQQQWKSLNDIPNMIEVQYLDKTKDYQQEMIAVIDETAIATGVPLRKKQIKVYTTKTSYALREGRYALKVNKYIDRSIAFKAGIDAIACQPADRIDVAHDVPQWGFSGRVQGSSTTSVVKLDQTIAILAGTTYKLQVKFSDDTILERTVGDAAGTYNQVTLTSTFPFAPSAYDLYSFGQSLKVVKPFRISNMKINNKNEVDIVAVEYDELAYDDSAVVIPTSNYSALSVDTSEVENLTLTEGLIKLGDGTIENVIDVWFRKPTQLSFMSTYSKVKIYLSDNGGSSWEYRGESSGASFQILGGLNDGITYSVAVVSVSEAGQINDIATSPQASILLVGKSAPPSDVASFLVNQSRDRMYFSWDNISDVDVSGYEIRFGSSWSAAEIIASDIKSNNFILLNFRTGANQTYFIKAIDTSGNYSTNATTATITINTIPFMNIIQSFSEQTAWSGGKGDATVVGSYLQISSGKLVGSYECPVRDLGYVATFKVGIEEVVTQASNRAFNSDATAAFNDNSTDRFSGSEIFGAASFDIKTSQDNITWPAYADWQAGDYTCRYFRLLMYLERATLASTVQCSQLNYYADLPDVDEFGTGVVGTAAAGATITYTKTFHVAPVPSIAITSGSAYVAHFTSAPTTTGFAVTLSNLAGTLYTGNFSYFAHGV
jgi:predicted phage tail protein